MDHKPWTVGRESWTMVHGPMGHDHETHECNDNARKQIVTIKLVPEDFGITHPYFPTPELRAQGLDPFIQDFRSSRSLPA